MYLNKNKFVELIQKDKTEIEISKLLKISRTQLWRMKEKKHQVGMKFYCNLKKEFPNISLDELIN